MFKPGPGLFFAVFVTSQLHLVKLPQNPKPYALSRSTLKAGDKLSEKYLSTRHGPSPTFVHFDQTESSLIRCGKGLPLQFLLTIPEFPIWSMQIVRAGGCGMPDIFWTDICCICILPVSKHK